MKNKIFKKLISLVIIIGIVILIFFSSNFLYNLAIKYNILEEEIADTTSSDVVEIENGVHDIENILAKLYPINSNEKYTKNFTSSYNGIEAYINGSDVSILLRAETAETFSGLIAKSYFETNSTIRANVISKKEIKSLLVGFYQDSLTVEFMQDIPYVFFLMEDGTVEYIDIKILLKNGYLTNPAKDVRTRGTIKGLENIIKLEQCNLANQEDGYATAVAIDKDGNVYNLFDYIEWGNK